MSKKIDIKSHKYQEAIRLKFAGEAYSVIAKKLKVSVYTVESWFYFGGLLKEEYDKYRDERTEMLGMLCDETLAKNVHIAANMLVALMGSPEDGVKFRAVKEILDRVRGAPKSNGEQGLFGTDISYEDILEQSRKESSSDG